MSKYKILNLYACLGGNRYKWDEVADVDVTAVDTDSEATRLYQQRFPNDTVIVADAHQYLLDHYREFDFIWSSPPCPTHSRVRITQKSRANFVPVFPSMQLYEEIIFLENYFHGKWIVENVIPYYMPLIPGKKRGRHIYWSNFNLPSRLTHRAFEGTLTNTKNEVAKLSSFHDFDFQKYKGEQRRDKIARNLVDYEAGKTILQTALGILESNNNVEQTSLFSF